MYAVINGELAHGLVPYRDFLFEYPPLALAPIGLPHLAGGSYAVWLGVEMGLALLVVQACVGKLAGRGAAWLFVLAPVLIGAQVRTHFDAVPAALVLGALALLARERPRATGGMVLLALGGLTKLFPLLLVPVAAVWLHGRGQARTAVRGTLACAAVVAVGIAPFLVTGGLQDMVSFHLQRPLQVESTAASVVLLAGDPVITGTQLHPDRFKSNGVRDPLTAPALGACLALAVALIALAIAAARRSPAPDHLRRCALLALLAFVALGKVLSPQYVIWLAPFAALAWARREWVVAVCLTAAVGLTQAWFPDGYFDLINRHPTEVWLVAARNALLLTALAATAVAVARSTPPVAVPARSG